MLPLADSSAAVAFSMFAIVVGYALIAALFYFMIYKPRKQEKEAERVREEEASRDG